MSCIEFLRATSTVVAISNPADGSTVTGMITAAAIVVSSIDVDYVEFPIDGVLQITDRTDPYQYGLDTTLFENGIHSLSVTAVDLVGGYGQATIAFTISNTSDFSCDVHVTSADIFPYALNSANKRYCVMENVVTAGTAFVVAADNVTLNLNDHTVTFGDSGFVTVPNGGFEDGIAGSPTDWDLGGAHGKATRSPKEANFFGDYELKFSNVTQSDGVLTVLSSAIALAAGQAYTAWLSVKGTDGMVQFHVINAADGSIVASSSLRNEIRYNAQNSLNIGGLADGSGFTPGENMNVYIRIEVQTTAGSGQNI